MNFVINRLQHIGIPVTNLAGSITFYEQLGFTSVMESSFEHPAGAGSVAMVKRNDIVLELYQFPPAELPAIRQRSDGHVDHIAFDVPDIEAAFAELSAGGFRVVEPAPVFLPFWENGCRYFNILGPDGERLEFNQVL